MTILVSLIFVESLNLTVIGLVPHGLSTCFSCRSIVMAFSGGFIIVAATVNCSLGGVANGIGSESPMYIICVRKSMAVTSWELRDVLPP